MLQNHTTIPVGVIVNDYKKIFAEVVAKDEPVIISSNGKPTVAIISLKTLEKLEGNQSAKMLMKLSQEVQKLTEGKGLPADLSEQHDDYVWKAE